MSHQAVLFDLDGVLIDTAELHQEAWQGAIRKFEMGLSECQLPSFRGVDREKCLDVILALAAGNNVSRNELRETKNRLYLRELEKRSRSIAVPGIKNLINDLRVEGKMLAVASASKNAHHLVTQAGLNGLFSFISDGFFNGPSKPSPAQFLELAKLLRLKPASCVVVEDSHVGLDAAKEAGMPMVGIGPEVRDYKGLVQWYPTLAGVTGKDFMNQCMRQSYEDTDY